MSAESMDKSIDKSKARQARQASKARHFDGGITVPYECPRCKGQDIWRNGQNSAGNQQYRCRGCGRVFVLEPYKPNAIVLIADRMLQQQIKVPVVAEVLQGFVSRRWLYDRRKSLLLGETC
jgi:transposase-like protein